MKKPKSYQYIKLIIILAVISIAAPKVLSQQADEVFVNVNEAIVVVEAYDFDGIKSSQGSGVILKDKNILITNFHIYAGNEKIVLKHKDKEIKYTEIIGLSIDKDVLILQLEAGDYPQVKIGNSANMKVGNKVYAIGSPMGLENTITEGLVGGFRKFDDKKNDIEYIQISASLSPGSSGGAVLNAEGELIGISTMGMKEGQNLNFAIKIEDVLSVDLGEYKDKVKLESINYFFKGKSLYEDTKYESAIEYFNKFLAKVPNDPICLNFRGLAYLQQKKYEEALKDFNQSSKIDPEYLAPVINKADINYKMENYEKAVSDYTKIINKYPDLIGPVYSRGLARMQLGDWGDAIKDFTKSIKIDKNYVQAYLNRGISYYYDKQYSEAVDDWTKAKNLNPSLAPQLNEWIDKADYFMSNQ
ncbi:MAG: tetratricopeptide repeat protein [Ignavibacteria bacterium]|nr:tetratricopeptide repeat protein [Ignavibacteria bacterium]